LVWLARLLQVAYREALTVLRQRRAVPVDPTMLPEAATTALGSADQAVLSDIAVEISSAFAQLGSDERMAVVLRDVEQLSMREVAEVLNVSSSAAKMRVHRGRQSLRHILSKRDITHDL
jgi:RNA polymerase sigma-70 factor (ECF subfamily)